MDEGEFSASLAGCIDGALNAAAHSPDVKDEDPFLAKLVALIQHEPEHRSAGIAVLCALVPRMEFENGVVELLEYCAHVLRPEELLSAVDAHARAATVALEQGDSLRPWHTRRLCRQILEAAEHDWEAGDIYPSLGRA
jgi:hypothetical protein